MNIDSPIETIPRVSSIYAKRLNRLGIKTIRDLIYHFPHRYDDLSKITKIGDIKINETVTVHGEIINVKTIRTFKKKMFLTEALVKDETGTIRAVWYNQPFLMRTLKKGTWVSLAGKTTYDGKTLFFSNPVHEKIQPASDIQRPLSGTHTGRLVPVYPETARLTSKWLRYILNSTLPKALPEVKDFLPDEVKKSQKLIGLRDALKKIHFPETNQEIKTARRRLGFDELFLIQLLILQQKQKWQAQNAPKIKFDQKLIKDFVDSLPFKLTNVQRKAAWEILQDLEKSRPMNRLLEGDVGSGKTVVATIAALQTVNAGYQAAFMAPTEILAQQHFKSISELLEKSDVKIALLTSSESKISFESPLGDRRKIEKATKKNLFEKIKQGDIKITIGTHALIQDKVRFKNLALAIVDEQHRFGVQQRAALQKQIRTSSLRSQDLVSSLCSEIAQMEDGLSTTPHLLSMTATPIPRTLALTIYGDLDLSLLDEMPKGRQEIITKIVAPANRPKAYDFIRQQIKNGRQVFVICPRIEKANKNDLESEPAHDWRLAPYNKLYTGLGGWGGLGRQSCAGERQDRRKYLWLDVKAVEEEYEKLSKKIFPDLRIAMLHGKLKPKEKEQIMSNFRARKYDILVSTSVVEVGIDVPNASVMMIENAERFGLAQLHQFRGRVGRSEHQSFCFLFTESSSRSSHARLRAIITAKTGFELAEKDLEIRGPGEFYGTRQWGLPDLTMASLSDVDLIKQCREEAKKLLDKDPELKNHSLFKEKLSAFQTHAHLE